MDYPRLHRFKVTEDLLDDIGHVNNANYLRLYEDARWKILDESGLGSNIVKKINQGPIILEITIRFRHELILNQEVIIETTCKRKGSRLFYFDQLMKDDNGKIFSTAVFTGAVFDLEKRTMITPDEKWIKAFGI